MINQRTILQNEQTKYHKKQQETLQIFFTNFLSWDTGNIGQWIVTGIMEVVLGIFLWIPYQEMSKEGHDSIRVLLFPSLWGAMTYLLPYIQFTEDKRNKRVYEKLKYLPISLKELRYFRLKKLTVFCFKLFLIFLAGQLFFSAVFFHEITLANIAYPAFYGLILPLVINGPAWWFAK